MPTFALGWRRSASSVNDTLTSGWRASADAQTFVSRSVTLTLTSGWSSRAPATSALARVMSAETWSWKTGTCQASVRRRAIVRRMLVSGTCSTSPAGTGAAAGAAAARSTSSAMMRPSGPVPVIDVSSIPRSRAIRRASGEALTRSPGLRGSGCAAAGFSGSSAFGSSVFGSSVFGSSALGFSAGGAETLPFPDTSGTSSPASPMNAIVVPTGTSPSETAILSSTPPASASTSCVTFSVSSS